MFLERTLRQKVTVEGIGLHTGKSCSLAFCPAPAGTGIHFLRKDMEGQPSVPASYDRVRATSLATTLGGDQFSVSTVEHCLSALSALRIDNLIIELDGPEIPIIDGSAQPYLEALLQSGFVDLDKPRKYLYISSPIFVGNDQKHAYVVPYNGLRVTCTIDFPHPKIGIQTLDIDINESSFENEISRARTFGFFEDVQKLQAQGLALGGSLNNAIVLDKDGLMNPEGLRYPDEFVRHKILDALGDLVTLGHPLMGHIILYKAGHDLMNQLVRKIAGSEDCVRFVEMGADPVINENLSLIASSLFKIDDSWN